MKTSKPLSAALKKVKRKFEASQKNLQASYRKKVEKIYKNKRKRPVVLDYAKENDLSYHLFANALGKIGVSSDTQTVAERIRKTNLNARNLAKRNPKRFMQLMYSSASYLVEQGVLTRKKLGHNYFEYSLKSWSKKSPKNIVKASNKVAA
jgi:hypothetical protein